MQIKFIWHSRDNMHLGPHQSNVNIRIGSVTTSSRNNLVGPLTVSRTSANDRICSMLRNYSGLWLTRRRERTNKIQNVGPLCNSSGPIKNRITRSSLFIIDVNLNRYLGNIIPITICWATQLHIVKKHALYYSNYHCLNQNTGDSKASELN